MNDKRVFTQRVSMPCTLVQYKKHLRSDLIQLGYDSLDKYEKDHAGPTKKRMLSLQVNWEPGRVSWSDEKTLKSDRILNIDFNPDLFLALAGMSADEEMFPGEWVTPKDKVNYPDYLNLFEVGEVHENLISPSEAKDLLWKNNFRKATAEEIMAHFQNKDSNFLYQVGELVAWQDPECEETNECLCRVLNVVDSENIRTGGHYDLKRCSDLNLIYNIPGSQLIPVFDEKKETPTDTEKMNRHMHPITPEMLHPSAALNILAEKPLQSRKDWENTRIQDLCRSCTTALKNGDHVDEEWISELSDLLYRYVKI